MQRLSGSDRRSEGSRVRNIRDVQKRKAWLKKQIARLQKDGGGSRSSGIRKTQLERYRKELARLGGQGNLPTTTRSGGSKETGMSNLGSDYKKEEKLATKNVKKWRKTDEYNKGVESHNESLKVKANRKTDTKSPNTKLKTWRVDSDKNRQLQTERKEGKDETYSRVTPQNDSSKKPLGTETKEQYLERTKNSPAAQGGVGKDQRWAAYQNYLRFKAKKRSSKEERRKRRDALLKKKKNALKIGKK
jgi:hypothetical protein